MNPSNKPLWLSYFFIISSLSLFSSKAFADFTRDSETSRQAIISTRLKKFYNSKKPINRIAIGGSYDFDQNSKQYQLVTRYFYQSYRFIHDLNFLHEVEYNDRGSGKNKQEKAKTSEFYDFSLSSKLRIFQTNNYAAFYQRTVYDDMSTYYYDRHTAIGIGRMFFDDAIEFDASVGYHDSKNYGHSLDFIPSIRINLKLTNKVTFNQRGYWYIDHRSVDNELKTSLIYRLGQRTSLELRHTFEQRRYEDEGSKHVENQVHNLFTIGMIFDL